MSLDPSATDEVREAMARQAELDLRTTEFTQLSDSFIAEQNAHAAAKARADLAEQREMEARRTAEEWRQESQDNLQALERVRQERETFRRNRNEFSAELMRAKVDLGEAQEAWRLIPPHEMVIICPNCQRQHLDVGEFATRVHRKHKCENTPLGPNTGCGHLWAPYPYATKGVASTTKQEIDRLMKEIDYQRGRVADRDLILAADDLDTKTAKENQQRLGNLLAVIHRDGGHYIEKHGWEKAAKDAEAFVSAIHAKERT